MRKILKKQNNNKKQAQTHHNQNVEKQGQEKNLERSYSSNDTLYMRKHVI